MNSNKVTVLMPAYNAEKYITQAISSILCQEYENFILTILDDGSTDNTGNIIDLFEKIDQRIKIIREPANKGIFNARQRLIESVETEYFSWMDADDVSTPDRLKKQLDFLASNDSVSAVGSWCRILNGEGIKKTITDPDELRAAFLVSCPFQPATATIRTKSIKEIGFDYIKAKELIDSAEDYAFFSEFIKKNKIAILSEPLYLYRQHENQESQYNLARQRKSARKISYNSLINFGFDIPKELEYYTCFFYGDQAEEEKIINIGIVYKKIIKNPPSGYNKNHLQKHLGIAIKRMCLTLGIHGIYTYCKIFGIFSLFNGKKFGYSFIADCMRYKRDEK